MKKISLKTKIISAVFGFLLLAVFVSFLVFDDQQEFTSKASAASGEAVRGYAWSGTTGWISLNCANDNTCSAVNYSVAMDKSTGDFSGYAWSANIGWIDFAPTSGYPGTPFSGVHYDSATGNITGWAKIISLGDNGWLKMNGGWSGGVRIDPVNGNLVGWAWNGADTNADGLADTGIGWVNFDIMICDADSNGYLDLSCGGDNTTTPIIYCDADRNGFVDVACDPDGANSTLRISSCDLDGNNFLDAACGGDNTTTPLYACDANGNSLLDLSCGGNDMASLSGLDKNGNGYVDLIFCDRDNNGYLDYACGGDNYSVLMSSLAGPDSEITLAEFLARCDVNSNDYLDYACGGSDAAAAMPDYKNEYPGAKIVISPAAPSGLTAREIDCHAVKLEWADNSGDESGFEVDASADGLEWASLSPDLAPDVNYKTVAMAASAQKYFRVRALGAMAASDWAPAVGGILATTSYCPPAPTVVSYSCNGVSLSWTVEGEYIGAYKVYRKEDGGDWALLADGVVGVSYIDSNIEPGTIYEYKIETETETLTPTIVKPGENGQACRDLPIFQERGAAR